MDSPESLPLEPFSPESSDDLRPQPHSRSGQVFLLGSILILTLSLNLVLLCQVVWLGKDLARNQRTIAEFEVNDGPMLNRFYRQLVDYGRTHSDFIPILAKYRMVTVTPTSASTPPTNSSK